MALDIRDNKLGDVNMDVLKTDAGIIQLLALSRKFAADWGIPQASVSLGNTGVTGSGKDSGDTKKMADVIRKAFGAVT